MSRYNQNAPRNSCSNFAYFSEQSDRPVPISNRRSTGVQKPESRHPKLSSSSLQSSPAAAEPREDAVRHREAVIGSQARCPKTHSCSSPASSTFHAEELHAIVEAFQFRRFADGNSQELDNWLHVLVGDMDNSRALHKRHPISGIPFETFFNGSWHQTTHLTVKEGVVSAHFTCGGTEIEETFSGNNVRIRSQKAEARDCKYFLRPNLDIAVLRKHHAGERSAKDLQQELHNAKIISISRKPHESQCTCLFYVKLYRTETVSNRTKTVLETTVDELTIGNIFILQKPKFEIDEEGYRYCSFSENFEFMKQCKLSSSLASDLAWLVVLSVSKEILFDVRFMENVISYLVTDTLETRYMVNTKLAVNSKMGIETEQSRAPNKEEIKVLTFQICGKAIRPEFKIVDKLLKLSHSSCEAAGDSLGGVEQNESECKIFEDTYNLRRSMRQRNQPDRFMSYFHRRDDKKNNAKADISCVRKPQKEASHSFATNTLHRNVKIESSQNIKCRDNSAIHRTHPKEKGPSADKRNGRGRYVNRESEANKSYKESSKMFSHSKNIRSGKRKILLSASECRVIIDKCTKDITSNMKKKPRLNFDWEADCVVLPQEQPLIFNWDSPISDKVEEQEYDYLWKEMDYALATLPFLEENQGINEELSTGMSSGPDKYGELPCNHECVLDEEVGIICCLCNSVITEIRYVLPSFGDTWKRSNERTTTSYSVKEPTFDCDINTLPSKGTATFSGCQSVWGLIPSLRAKMYSHQKKAFEFLWKNIGGSLKPDGTSLSRDRGGCVVSHSPGSGKTLLMVAFLASFLKVYCGQRPMVLAPKSTLHVWTKEFEKWGVSVPVYIIYPFDSYRRDFRNQKRQAHSVIDRRPNLKSSHIMDCLEKLRKWHEQPSVLLMSYQTFTSLTLGGSGKSYQNFMADVLLKSPGILVLDEGHNPRSTKSKLRRLLMTVKTQLRVLLSGTLFQNNFGEYFNTICLARPEFVLQVIKKWGSKMGRMDRKTGKKIESLSRKIFIQEIGYKIESCSEKERQEGFVEMVKTTENFVDAYDGDMLDNLPGLEIYTIILRSSAPQESILSKLLKLKKHNHSWELDLLMTVGAIHPWLIRSISGAPKYFNEKELEDIETYKRNFCKGSKVKFVVDVVHKSSIRGEKVLIFCRNIAPITMLVDIFEIIFQWKRGEQILVLQGDQDLFTRGRTIDKFNKEHRGASSVLLASTTACSEGISLTAASRVILLDSEWNYAKTKQAIARAFRPGQEKVVYVYQLLALGTLEEKKYARNEWKEWLSRMIVTGEYIERGSSSNNVGVIEDEMLKDLVENDQLDIFHKITKQD